jgi:ligand-binding sensor domain-containing protein
MDRKGNLWFGTHGGGVSRYDGKSFTTYNTMQGLANNSVFAILQDKNDNIWFSTWGGVSRYDGKSFRNLNTNDGLADPEVRSMIEDKKGDLWFGTEEGLSHYDGTKFKNYNVIPGLAGNDIISMLQDKHGNIWLGTSTGLSCFDGKSFTNYTASNGLPNNYIRSILEDKEGKLWIGTDGGVSTYDRKSFTNYSMIQGLPSNQIRKIVEDKQGNLWFGTLGGVSRYDGKLFRNYTVNEGLCSNLIRTIVEDTNGSLWFGTDGDGISRYDGDAITSYTKKQGLPENEVSSIFQDKNKDLWFGTYAGGLTKFDGKYFTTYSIAQGLAGNNISQIIDDKNGNLWIGTGDGVSLFDGSSFTNFTTAQGLPETAINDLLEDTNGNIWFSTFGGGVSMLNSLRKSFTTYSHAQGLPDTNSHAIFEDKNSHIWFGHDNGGISRYDGEFFTNYDGRQGVNSHVSSIHQDQNGNLWIGTMNGISRYDGKSFTNYNTIHGLPDESVADIIQDDEGTLWIGTRVGFSSLKFNSKQTNERHKTVALVKGDNPFSNEELNKGYDPKIVNYNFKVGYPVRHVNSMFVDADGIIWIGTGDKLIRFNRKEIYQNVSQPEVFLQSVKINNESICWNKVVNNHRNTNISISASDSLEEVSLFGKILSDSQRNEVRQKWKGLVCDSIAPYYPVPVNLVLPYQHNSVSFDFAVIEPARSNLVRYQSKLEGYDKDWTPASNKSTASFGNIREGTYTLKIRAWSPDGIMSKTLLYKFKVLPPWYRTWWAYSLYILTFLVALWSFIKWRIRTLKKEKAGLEKTVSIRTNELRREKEKVEGTLTELKATQAQLIQSEKMASLGEVTAGIAHEIQNPLNFVNNFSDVNTELISEMEKEIDKGNFNDVKAIAKDIKDNEQKINHHGKRADAIVKGMLQHSRAKPGKRELTDFNALADEYLKFSYYGLRAKNNSFNANFKTEFDESIGKIDLTPQDIGRALLNLYNNAFYSIDEKKKRFNGTFEPTILVKTKRLARSVELSLKDNGSGIPQKVLDKIFQPFFTTKPPGQGTGLGLSLAYDIIKAHGGEIRVETEEGVGSEFIIQLPLS